MQKVYKYTLEGRGQSSPPPISIPCHYKVLRVAYQADQLCVWVLVDTTSIPLPVRFEVVGTGWDVHDDWVHEGSVQEPDGYFIWHVFRVGD